MTSPASTTIQISRDLHARLKAIRVRLGRTMTLSDVVEQLTDSYERMFGTAPLAPAAPAVVAEFFGLPEPAEITTHAVLAASLREPEVPRAARPASHAEALHRPSITLTPEQADAYVDQLAAEMRARPDVPKPDRGKRKRNR